MMSQSSKIVTLIQKNQADLNENLLTIGASPLLKECGLEWLYLVKIKS